MLTLSEKRILLGLYLRRPRLGGAGLYRPDQINWIASHPYGTPSTWKAGNVLDDAVEEGSEAEGDAHQQLMATGWPLEHLQGAGFIQYEIRVGAAELLSISVTHEGAEVARLLNTRRGRLDFWYREHKDGLAGVLLTILIAAITALLTTWLRLKR